MAHSKTVSSSKSHSKSTSGITLHEEKKVRTEFSGIKWLDNLFENYEFNRYGIYVVMLLVVGCLGGVAVGTGSMTNPFQIAVLVVPTMASLVMMLAVAPMRALIWVSLIAILVDILMITYNLLV